MYWKMRDDELRRLITKTAHRQIRTYYAMSSDSDINNSSGEKFRHDEWIGTGRVLPADPNAIPAGLGKLFESLQDVPQPLHRCMGL